MSGTYDGHGKPRLQALCRERQLPTSGTKIDLVGRLEEYDRLVRSTPHAADNAGAPPEATGDATPPGTPPGASEADGGHGSGHDDTPPRWRGALVLPGLYQVLLDGDADHDLNLVEVAARAAGDGFHVRGGAHRAGQDSQGRALYRVHVRDGGKQ